MFLAPALDQASQLKLTEIKEKVGSLERLLERDVAKSSNSALRSDPGQERALPDDAEDELPANEDEKDLEPTPLAVVDAAYEVDGEDDDLLDLGIQLGKMRITERIGGFFRPKISQEVRTFLMYSESLVNCQRDCLSMLHYSEFVYVVNILSLLQHLYLVSYREIWKLYGSILLNEFLWPTAWLAQTMPSDQDLLNSCCATCRKYHSRRAVSSLRLSFPIMCLLIPCLSFFRFTICLYKLTYLCSSNLPCLIPS